MVSKNIVIKIFFIYTKITKKNIIQFDNNLF
jgi:hypothetical protein